MQGHTPYIQIYRNSYSFNQSISRTDDAWLWQKRTEIACSVKKRYTQVKNENKKVQMVQYKQVDKFSCYIQVCYI